MTSNNVAGGLRGNAESTRAHLEALRREISTLRWMMGLGFTALGIEMTLQAMLLKQTGAVPKGHCCRESRLPL